MDGVISKELGLGVLGVVVGKADDAALCDSEEGSAAAPAIGANGDGVKQDRIY
jgi:hypothetical protein